MIIIPKNQEWPMTTERDRYTGSVKDVPKPAVEVVLDGVHRLIARFGTDQRDLKLLMHPRFRNIVRSTLPHEMRYSPDATENSFLGMPIAYSPDVGLEVVAMMES